MIQTEAIVLHAFDYRETSRIVRLATRGAGVVSAIARGARRPRSRFGQGLDLFSGGVAHLTMHPTRDLHALTAFDVARARTGLGQSLARFGAAAALAEVGIRFGQEDGGGAIHDTLDVALDLIARAEPDAVASRALASAWHLVRELGFAPTLDECAACHRPLAVDEAVRFAHRTGGALCRSCASLAPGARPLPPEARCVITAWSAGEAADLADAPAELAHLRLLREFLEEHLGDGRPLRAWVAWADQLQRERRRTAPA